MTEKAHTVENNPGRIDEIAGAEGDPDNDVVSSTHEAVRAISELPLAEQAAQFEALADQLRAELERPGPPPPPKKKGGKEGGGVRVRMGGRGGAPVGAGSGGDSLESEPECWFGPGTGVLGGGSLEGEQEGTLDSDEAGAARVGQRLDALLAQRGLARSRTHATALIAAGLVTVDGHPVTKNSYRVPASSAVAVAASDHRSEEHT